MGATLVTPRIVHNFVQDSLGNIEGLLFQSGRFLLNECIFGTNESEAEEDKERTSPMRRKKKNGRRMSMKKHKQLTKKLALMQLTYKKKTGKTMQEKRRARLKQMQYPDSTPVSPTSTSPSPTPLSSPKAPRFKVGQRVLYTRNGQPPREATITEVHLDNDMVHYYSIDIDGKGKDTVDRYLSPVNDDSTSPLPPKSTQEEAPTSQSSTSSSSSSSFRPRRRGLNSWLCIVLFFLCVCLKEALATTTPLPATVATAVAAVAVVTVTRSTKQLRTEMNARANLDYSSPSVSKDEEECTVEWCEDALNAIKTDDNKHVIEYIIEVILPQVKVAKFIPVFIGLCPTPERRGHESLGGKGRRDRKRKTQALNHYLPTREQGGIDSGNSDLPHAFWVNARETCTNDGKTCNVCKSWRKYEADAIGQALCILSKCVKYYGGYIVAINIAGVSVNAHCIFDYLRNHSRFDGLCDYGTHISKLGCRCKAWTKSHQCSVATRTLDVIDSLLASIYHKVNIEPPASFLQTGLENSLFKYVTPDGNVGSCSEKCAECDTANATKVDMLLLESLEVNDSSFNEGQEEEDDDANECDNDGNKIALCMVCDECAQARVDKHDDSNDLSTQYMPLAEFRSEQKRAKRREYRREYRAKRREELKAKIISEEGDEAWKAYEAARLESEREYRAKRREELKAKIISEEGDEAWKAYEAARLESERKRSAARYAQIKEEGGEKYDELLASTCERYAQIKEEGGEKYDELLASKLLNT